MTQYGEEFRINISRFKKNDFYKFQDLKSYKINNCDMLKTW